MQDINFDMEWEYKEGYWGRDEKKNDNWTQITLPHDACIGLKRNAEAPSGGAKGYYPDGAFIYRKKFWNPEENRGKCISFLFEGVYCNSVVWINGIYAGQCSNGYSEFVVPVTHLLKYGEINEIAVSLRTGRDSRWYSGAGIYRSVHMIVEDSLCVPLNGVRITTKSADVEVAAVELEIHVKNRSLDNRTILVETEIRNKKGELVTKDHRLVTVYGASEEKISPRVYIKEPALWSCESPQLYQCEVRLTENGQVIDSVENSFGLRELTLDPERGLRINGSTVKIYGGCIHHDNGILGAAENKAAAFRRIRRLRDAGYNGVRSAHHPMSRALLEACDHYGMLVMDEVADIWHMPKTAEDFASHFDQEWEQVVTAMVLKDYNHPSVILYSIGNEIPETGNPSGGVMSRKMANIIKELDDTRFVTAGVNGVMSNYDRFQEILAQKKKGLGAEDVNQVMMDLGSEINDAQCWDFVIANTRESMEALDIAGYNYSENRYRSDSLAFTNRICLGTESVPKMLPDNWKMVLSMGNVLGDFGWTAWGYIGEAGIGKNLYHQEAEEGFGARYPYFLGNCGDFDIIGERRPQSYYREIVIGQRTEPYIAVVNPSHYGEESITDPWSWSDSVNSWNWEGFEGKPVMVEVYSDADEVELFINEISCGRKTVKKDREHNEMPYSVAFDAIYQPGSIRAVAYRQRTETGSHTLRTADSEVHIEAIVEHEVISWDSMDMGFVLVRFVDETGRLNTNADRDIRVKVYGSGALQGIGNGNPVSEESFTEDHHFTYNGKALIAVRPNALGEIRVVIWADGCESVEKNIYVR